MITKDFYIKDLDLNYYVGITQIKFELNQFIRVNQVANKGKVLNKLFSVIEKLENRNRDSTIQLIKDTYILNQDHIFTACYYVQKGFTLKTNISNKKNIELLLYLSTLRQISKGIEAFGIDLNDLNKGELIFCIISQSNNLNTIKIEILNALEATEIELSINNLTIDKINRITRNYELSETQIETILRSYVFIEDDVKKLKTNLEHMSSAVYDLICEKMALLSLEKIKINTRND
ncbi:MAG: KEOPS complex subunit Cgi121 [Promethearchaeota archaeon]